jgi:hypothetical protein
VILLTCGYALACLGFREPRRHLGQRLARACSTASLCPSCSPTRRCRVVDTRLTGQDVCVSAPCGQRLAGSCSSASLFSSAHSLVSVGLPRFTGAISCVSAPGRTQSPPFTEEMLQPPSCLGWYVACAVPCRTSSEAPTTGLVERASRCAVPLVLSPAKSRQHHC